MGGRKNYVTDPLTTRATQDRFCDKAAYAPHKEAVYLVSSVPKHRPYNETD